MFNWASYVWFVTLWRNGKQITLITLGYSVNRFSNLLDEPVFSSFEAVYKIDVGPVREMYSDFLGNKLRVNSSSYDAKEPNFCEWGIQFGI